jgi:ribose transport system permease protein
MAAPSESKISFIKRYPLLGPLFGFLFVLFLFEAMIYSCFGLNFLTPNTVGLILVQTVIVATGALGATLIIVSGGIDLSAGSAVALSGVVAAVILRDGHSAWLAVLGALGVGALIGLVNGVIIAWFNLMPFIVTLGTMSAVRGLAQWVGNNQTVNYDQGGSTEGINALMNPPLSLYDASIEHFKNVNVGGVMQKVVSHDHEISHGLFTMLAHVLRPDPDQVAALAVPLWVPPYGVFILLALTILMSIVLNRSVFGRHIFALGSNEATARLCGLRTRWLKIGVYVIGGVFIGLAGVFNVSYLTQGDVTAGMGMELDIITAVVIGGASLNGGVGSIWGAVIGALTMTSLHSGCVGMRWPTYYQLIIIGVVIVLAVGVDKIRSRGLKG